MDTCTFETSGIYTAPRNTNGQDLPSKKIQKFSSYKEDLMGKVIIGSKQESLYNPRTSAITFPGVIKTLHGATYLI